MKKEDFEKEEMPNGKIIYKHIKHGQLREELLKMATDGKISVKEMNSEARMLPYLFSESKYLKAIEL